MQFKADLKGLEPLEKKLKYLSDITEDELLEGVAKPIMSATIESFANETDPWGNPWVKQDSPTYNHLDRTDNMKSSLSSKVSKGSVHVGLGAVSKDGYNYPAVQQFGSKKESGRGSNIPARAFMPVDIDGNLEPSVEADVIESVTDLIEFHIYK